MKTSFQTAKRCRRLHIQALEERCNPAPLFAEDFSDNSAGWTLGSSWQIGPATLSNGHTAGYFDPHQDHSPTTDNGVAGVVIGGNVPSGNTGGLRYLTSPTIDTSAQSSATLSFARWLNTDGGPFKYNSIEVFNGTGWIPIFLSFQNHYDNSWNEIAYDLSAYRNEQMRVRFGFAVQPNIGAATVSGWNIDDFAIGRLPTATDDALQTNRNSPVVFDSGQLVGNDVDADGDSFSLTAVDTQSKQGGQISFNGSKYSYEPADGFTGDDEFHYTVTEATGLTSKGIVRVRVNAPPTAVADTYATAEDHDLVISTSAGLLANDSDSDGDVIQCLGFAQAPTLGSGWFSTNGSLVYEPNDDVHGTDTFTYILSDGFTTTTGTVTIHITPVVDAPWLLDLHDASDTGLSNVDNLTAVRTPTITGRADAGARVYLLGNGDFLGLAVADAAGSWSFTTPSLNVGPHELTAFATDASDNFGPVSQPLHIVVAGEPIARIAMAADKGVSNKARLAPTLVAVFNGQGQDMFGIAPSWNAGAGIRIATGDLNGDGVADIAMTPVTGPLRGTIVAYSGTNGSEMFRVTPFGLKSRTDIAIGDVNGDGYGDLLAAGLNGFGANRVLGLSGKTGAALFDWLPTPGTHVKGILTADVNGDLKSDVVLTQVQKKLGWDVVAYNIADRSELQRFDGGKFGLNAATRLALGHMNADQKIDLVVSTGGKTPSISFVSGLDGATRFGTFTAPGGGAGARAVRTADLNNDGRAELIVGAAVRSNGRVNGIDMANTTTPLWTITPFGDGINASIEV